MIERTRRAGWRWFILRAALLSTGVVAWEQWLHVARGVHSAGPLLPHLLLDGGLAFPLALAAIVLAVRIARPGTFARALTAATTLSATLIPAVSMHARVHVWLGAHSLPRGLHLHARAGESASWLAHGARDALAGFPVALGIAMLMFGVRFSVPLVARRAGILALAASTAFTGLAARATPPIPPFQIALPIAPTLQPNTDGSYTLTAQQTDLPVLDATKKTTMWTFNGTFPGPTIHATSGQPMTLHVVNDLPVPAAGADPAIVTVHQHGEHAESASDGQPHDNLIAPGGGSYTYHYDYTEGGASPERGAFQWYHDHFMDYTGEHVWKGLAGMVILDDPTEATINAALPSGARDVPLMVVDRTFDANNQIPYSFNSEGNLGNAILVNGAPQPFFDVEPVKYRLRLLNASNARTYDFKMSDGQQMIQVATESGLLPAPVARTDIRLGPAERAEVIVDFSQDAGRNDVTLQNTIGFTTNLKDAMQFHVGSTGTDSGPIPAVLRAEPTFDPANIAAARSWVFDRDPVTAQWQINGHGFDSNVIDAKPKLGTTELWTFVNTTDVDHIVHIHDVDWKVVSRSPTPSNTDGALGENGLRESFRLRPNEVVTVESTFTDHTGIFVVHCHILEHEDDSMMTQFQVVP